MARLLPALHGILAASPVRTTALVIVPTSFAQLSSDAGDARPGYLHTLEASPYLLGEASLAAGEHAFVHGRNHAKSTKKKQAKGDSLYTADFHTRLALLSSHTADGMPVGVADASSAVASAGGAAVEPIPSGGVQALLDLLTSVWKDTLEERREAFKGRRKERNRKRK